MKKQLIFSLTAAAMVFGMNACKKDDKKSNSTSDLIVGKWQIDTYAFDYNYNDVIDDSEKEVPLNKMAHWKSLQMASSIWVEPMQNMCKTVPA